MVAVVLLMIVGGIGLALGVSDPRQVTLRWLRLGGLIAAALLGATAAILATTRTNAGIEFWTMFGVASAAFGAQLMTVQRAQRRQQRGAGLVGFLFATFAASEALCHSVDLASLPMPVDDVLTWPIFMLALWSGLPGVAVVLSPIVGAGLLGGCLMTMLLGHAYLTAGDEMTQAPMRRLVIMLGILIVLRLVVSAGFGLWPWWAGPQDVLGAGQDRVWIMMMITARYAVGLIVPALFIYMIYDCVHRRANQSATGILYVTLVLIVIGEGAALALTHQTGLVF